MRRGGSSTCTRFPGPSVTSRDCETVASFVMFSAWTRTDSPVRSQSKPSEPFSLKKAG